MQKIEKIIDYIRSQGITNALFERNAKLSNGYIANMLKTGSEVTEKMWQKILVEIPELESKIESRNHPGSGRINSKIVPVFSETGNKSSHTAEPEIEYGDPAVEYKKIDELDLMLEAEAILTVWGQSMAPNYPPGTALALERNHDGFIEPGEVCVIETKSRRVFKRVFPSEKGDDYLTCYSDNTTIFEAGPMSGKYAYPPFDILRSEIIAKWDVLGIQRRNKNERIYQK